MADIDYEGLSQVVQKRVQHSRLRCHDLLRGHALPAAHNRTPLYDLNPPFSH